MNPVTLHHVIDGPERAPALVLAASLGTTLSVWDPLMPALTGAFRVIRFDHRGHGGSPAPQGPYSIADLGSDVVALLDRLRVERASFCGLSLGGMIGIWLAIHAPHRLDHLTLVCTSAFLPPPDKWRARAAIVREQGASAVAEAVVQRWLTPAFAAKHPEWVGRLTETLSACDAQGYASCCEAIAQWDERERLGAISAPTLVVAASEDTAIAPAHAYAMGAGIPSARVVVVDRAAHLAVVERPGLIARLIVDHGSGRPIEGSFAAEADAERASRGELVRRAVLGDVHVERARAKATSFSAPFQDFVNRFPWGDIWTRPGLSRAERSIVALSVLAALQCDGELAMHVVAALRNGLTVTQIQEILLQVGAYAGVPAANGAFAVADRALEQARALAQDSDEP